jgi:hypothetical protein
MLFFSAVIHCLVEETNRYYHQYLETLDARPSPLHDVTVPEMMLFLAIKIQMGHDIRNLLKNYWSPLKQFYTSFCSNIMKCDRFFRILRFLHFTNNSHPDMTDRTHDQLWTMTTIFDTLINAYAKFYSPSEHLATDKATVLFKKMSYFQAVRTKKVQIL